MFSPFFSWIADMIVLMIFERCDNRAALFLFRVDRDASCSNNLRIFSFMFLVRHLNLFTLLKNSNLLPERPLHRAPGMPFIELQSVDSTNNYALTMVHAGLALQGTAVFAHQQVAGKGQRGKTWLSEKGSSLSLSLIMDPAPLEPHEQFRLSACIAVALCGLVRKYVGDNVSIKWPNDIYWQDRKAGGILIESVIGSGLNNSGEWKWAIAGIGLNINQVSFPAEVANAISFRQITGRNFLPASIARELCELIPQAFSDLIENGFEHIYATFNELLYKNGQTVKLREGNRVFQGTIKGVSGTGELIVEHGIERRYAVGEV